ncbi:hypothetical protein DPMN_096741 [Dreissena polymorpha]|uniref:Uncharacterized protein n=1 Tax=Dreissena polymorpha TaxID=45954 RepID=A0A9D4LBN1_DREPO|nr:hypothetical protein DPMN_096741 [Dreissena polymorpha]
MFKHNFGWAWSMWARRSRIDRIVNRCRNEEVNFQGSSRKKNWYPINLKEDGHLAALTVINDPGMGNVDMDGVRSKFQFQGSSANSVGGDSGQDGRTDGGDQYNIPTLLKAWG